MIKYYSYIVLLMIYFYFLFINISLIKKINNKYLIHNIFRLLKKSLDNDMNY